MVPGGPGTKFERKLRSGAITAIHAADAASQADAKRREQCTQYGISYL